MIPPKDQSHTRWLWVALAALSLANVWPFAAYRYVPFMDHPSLLLKANVIRHYTDEQLRYFENFQINAIPAPNVLADYLMAATALWMPIDWAGRLVVALTVFLLPLSVLFWLARAAPGNVPWAVLALTMTWSRFLYSGNEGFCLASCLLFWLCGLLARWDGQPRGPSLLLRMSLATAIYLTHFLVFFLAGLAVLVHAAIGGRSVRSWLTHAAILAPGLVLGSLWFLSGGLSGSPTPPDPFSISYKVQAVADGIWPAPWRATGASSCALGLALVCFVVFRAVAAWNTERRFAAALCLAYVVPALLTTRYVMLHFPDQRFWWLTVLCSLSLFPPLARGPALAVWLFGLAAAIGTNLDAARHFKKAENALIRAEQTFARFPKRLRLAYLGDPGLPPELHRCFEYYHIRSGGMGPHHLMGRHNSVRYKGHEPPRLTIADFGPYALGPWLDAYEAVLIFSNPTADSTRMVSALQENGYRLHSQLPFALLLHPRYPVREPPIGVRAP
ncbi:MAG: hypothetical protein FJ278_13290 [Planctomycetes bacterium]|nr:hypothetical protein [Planctomycetota bacterium]